MTIKRKISSKKTSPSKSKKPKTSSMKKLNTKKTDSKKTKNTRKIIEKKNMTIALKQPPKIFRFPENKRKRTLHELNKTIHELERIQETVRNKRQMSSTSFQNFDQKANHLYNLLSSVMKAINEMRMNTVRNIL